MVLLHEEEESNGRWNEQRGADVPHSLETQKGTSITGKFVVAA